MKKAIYDYNSKPQGITAINSANFNANLEDITAIIDKKLRRQRLVKVYEVGCGGGRNLQFLKLRYGKKISIYGSDLSKTAVKYALANNIGNIKVAKSVERPFRQKFDLVFILDLLEHLYDKEEVSQTLKLVSQELKPDGVFYLSVPLENNPLSHPWIFSHLGLPNLTLKYFGHTLRFNHTDMIQLVTSHLRIKRTDYHSHFLTQLSVLLTFFLPKVILTALGGSELETKFRDSNIEINKSASRTPTVLTLANSLYRYFKIPINTVCYFESKLLSNVRFGALAVNITATLPNKRKHRQTKTAGN